MCTCTQIYKDDSFDYYAPVNTRRLWPLIQSKLCQKLSLMKYWSLIDDGPNRTLRANIRRCKAYSKASVAYIIFNSPAWAQLGGFLWLRATISTFLSDFRILFSQTAKHRST